MVALVAQESMVALVAQESLVSRTGRHMQRYDKGRRQVVGTVGIGKEVLSIGKLMQLLATDTCADLELGIFIFLSGAKALRCIPYRYKDVKQTPEIINEEDIEVLVISSQKGKGYSLQKSKGLLFPKGGWETDESIKEAASRESMEEAGVTGTVESLLGTWSFKSKRHNSYYEGYMFPLLVQKQLDVWPEMNVRERIWMSVAEARKACQHLWMKEALDALVHRLTS